MLSLLPICRFIVVATAMLSSSSAQAVAPEGIGGTLSLRGATVKPQHGRTAAAKAGEEDPEASLLLQRGRRSLAMISCKNDCRLSKRAFLDKCNSRCSSINRQNAQAACQKGCRRRANDKSRSCVGDCLNKSQRLGGGDRPLSSAPSKDTGSNSKQKQCPSQLARCTRELDPFVCGPDACW